MATIKTVRGVGAEIRRVRKNLEATLAAQAAASGASVGALPPKRPPQRATPVEDDLALSASLAPLTPAAAKLVTRDDMTALLKAYRIKGPFLANFFKAVVPPEGLEAKSAAGVVKLLFERMQEEPPRFLETLTEVERKAYDSSKKKTNQAQTLQSLMWRLLDSRKGFIKDREVEQLRLEFLPNLEVEVGLSARRHDKAG